MMLFSFIAAADPVDHVLPHRMFDLGPIVVTNQMVMVLIAAVLMVLIFPALFKNASAEVPSGSRNFFESILEFLRIEVFRPALKQHTDRFAPFLWTVFFFILFCNLLGQLPLSEIMTLITGKESHISATATGNVTTTGALAICVFFVMHFSGIAQIIRSLMDGTYGHHAHEEPAAGTGKGHQMGREPEHFRGDLVNGNIPGDVHALADPTHHYADGDHGHAHAHTHGKGWSFPAALVASPFLYLWNFAPHAFRPQEGQSKLMWAVDFPLWVCLLALELLGAVIKPFSLMIRLFANMVAGHIVLGSLILMIPVTASLAMHLGVAAPITLMSLMVRFLELFVAFLQTYIFTFLTTLFIASAVAPEH